MINRPMPTPKDFPPANRASGAADRPRRQHAVGHRPRAQHTRMLPQAARDGPEDAAQRASVPARNMPSGAHRGP